MHYLVKTGKIFIRSTNYANERVSNLTLSKQITLGYVLMFFLMIFISGLSIYSIYKLDKAASNIEGRHSTLLNLLSSKKKEAETQKNFGFGNEMLNEAVKIIDEQIKYAYTNTFTIVGIALLFGGILILMIPRVITKPVSQLVNATRLVASGTYSYRVKKLTGSNEISMLNQAFNNMLEKIEYHHNELEKINEKNLKLLEETRRFNEALEAKVEEATIEIKEKHEELIKAERLAIIGEIATGIAHEIRNPLSGIAVALELMKNETQNLEEHKQTISDILREISRLEHIIKDLLKFAHLSYPQSLTLIECEPNEIVERSLGLIYIKAKEKGIDVEKKLNCSERFKVDPEQIQQVVINLLINGVEAMDKPGRLTIETGSSNGHVLIEISDTGCGFSEEDKEKIFRPFYSNKEYGTGLGLPISRRIVEIHKGKILASSEKDKGSRFTVIIPINL